MIHRGGVQFDSVRFARAFGFVTDRDVREPGVHPTIRCIWRTTFGTPCDAENIRVPVRGSVVNERGRYLFVWHSLPFRSTASRGLSQPNAGKNASSVREEDEDQRMSPLFFG